MTAPSRYLRPVRSLASERSARRASAAEHDAALRAEQAETHGDEARVQVCIDGFIVEALVMRRSLGGDHPVGRRTSGRRSSARGTGVKARRSSLAPR